MNHNQLGANGNYHKDEKSVDLSEIATSLLESEQIKQEFTELNQGAFIVDQLLGRIVAAGDVESGGKVKTPIDLIGDMQDYASLAGKHRHADARMIMTRQNGMRGMIDALSQDIRIGSLWTELIPRVTDRDSSGEVALSSIAMVGGYLDGVETTNDKIVGAGWKEAILSEVASYAHGSERARWDSNDLLSSEVELVRTKQQEWRRAADDARTAGVDMGIVARSADRLRRHQHAGKDIGHRAVDLVVSNPYDDLLKP